jgi:hypothetical protein
MNNPRFPKKQALDSITPNESHPFSSPQINRFQNAANDLEQRIRDMETSYLQDASSVTQSTVTSVLLDTYRLAVTMFDTKIASGRALLPEEQEIYDLCKSEISKTASPHVNSILGVLFSAIERVRDCLDEIKEWFGISSDADKASMALAKAGNVLLPEYGSLVEWFFTSVAEFFLPSVIPSIASITAGQIKCASSYQETRTVDKQLASDMLDIADYAYTGHGTSQTGEYTKLSASELPAGIRAIYTESTGLLKSARGLQVWLGKKGDNIVVSYSGTDPSNFSMVYADIAQLSSPSVLYLKAAGLLKLIAEQFSDKNIYVTGHSLGGGLTQFSLTACMKFAENRLTGFGYNPAGLSIESVNHLGDDRLAKAKKHVWIFMTCYDPVSSFGGKIGCLTTLPKSDKNGHMMVDLKECMKLYLTAPTPVKPVNITITARNHDTSDFIPYTRKLSIKSQNGTVYPLFNDSVTSPASDFVSVNIPQSLFNALSFSTSTMDCCLGVYNKYNGTAHTVINRLLLAAADTPVVTTSSIGNIHSSIIFGKYGLGIKSYMELIRKAYVDSGIYNATSNAAFETMMARLENPFTYDKEAWCAGIRVQFGIDMSSIFSRYPLAEGMFNDFLRSFTAQRADLYKSIQTTGAPTDAQKKDFITRLKTLALTQSDDLMGKAVSYSVITESQKTSFHNQIQSFCDMIIATY